MSRHKANIQMSDPLDRFVGEVEVLDVNQSDYWACSLDIVLGENILDFEPKSWLPWIQWLVGFGPQFNFRKGIHLKNIFAGKCSPGGGICPMDYKSPDKSVKKRIVKLFRNRAKDGSEQIYIEPLAFFSPDPTDYLSNEDLAKLKSIHKGIAESVFDIERICLVPHVLAQQNVKGEILVSYYGGKQVEIKLAKQKRGPTVIFSGPQSIHLEIKKCLEEKIFSDFNVMGSALHEFEKDLEIKRVLIYNLEL